MTVELAEYLIGLEKYVVQNGEQVNTFLLDIQFPMSFRLALSAPDDLDQNLLVDIKESNKKSLKISLHHQDQSTQNGLLRLDFNGRHRNPVEITSAVPEIFKPFAGQWLDNFSGHIHYVVDGLEIDDFPVKQLGGREDYIRILNEFFAKINLKTSIAISQQMRIL
jgi:hypothetical protein